MCRSSGVYLRSRGENIRLRYCAGEGGGLPPLARREPPCRSRPRSTSRSTSARAERTSAVSPSRIARSVYLRSRGENRLLSSIQPTAAGLPPLARRERVLILHARRGTRSTSARAERTVKVDGEEVEVPVYLRSRGENSEDAAAALIFDGLPPLARRERRGTWRLRYGGGSTSARAERTRRRAMSMSRARVYLRSRGENHELAAACAGCSGLPPLARREPQHGEVIQRVGGSTSARAERTHSPARRGRLSRVYLRSRGENARAQLRLIG